MYPASGGTKTAEIDNEKIPVLFSDWRAEIGADAPIGRQTYFDIDEVTLTSIKYALTDSAKVSLKPEDGNTIFPILDNGLQISTGLTVVLGKRSSGKTFTLSQISEQFPGGKYIKQFSLLSTDEDQDEKKFEELLKAKGDSVSESYLAPFKDVVNDVIPIDLNRDEHDIDAYLSALKKSAEEAQRQDVFSKAALYQETLFSIRSLTTLESLIDAVDVLITTLEYLVMKVTPVMRNCIDLIAGILFFKFRNENMAASTIATERTVSCLINCFTFILFAFLCKLYNF